MRTSATVALLGLAGAVVGLVGSALHRYEPYWGTLGVVALVFSAAMFSRAWRGWGGLTAFALGWLAAVMGLVYIPGPGESTLVLDDALGRWWVYGGAVSVVLVALAPAVMFKDRVDVAGA